MIIVPHLGVAIERGVALFGRVLDIPSRLRLFLDVTWPDEHPTYAASGSLDPAHGHSALEPLPQVLGQGWLFGFRRIRHQRLHRPGGILLAV